MLGCTSNLHAFHSGQADLRDTKTRIWFENIGHLLNAELMEESAISNLGVLEQL